MIGDLLVYNILKTALLTLLFVYGISLYKLKKSKTVIFLIIAIIAFSLIEGLRWDRGPDYYNNYLLLTTNSYMVAKSEPVFTFITTTLRDTLLLPYWGCFIFFSFFYIFSYTKVVGEFRKAAIWALPVMFLTTVDAHENLIRQFIGISFTLLAYYSHIKKYHIATFVLLICAILTHYSGAFAFVLFYIIAILKPENIIKKPIILVAIYLVLFFFWDTSYLNPITNVLTKIDIGTDSMQGYLDNADRWFTEEGSISALKGKGGIASLAKYFFTLVTNCTIIYWGYKTIKYDQRLRIPYWFTFIALIIHVIGGDIEIYDRFAWWLYPLMPIVLGAIWYIVPMNKKTKMALMFIIAFSYIYAFIMSFTTIPYYGFAFVWDL